MRLTKEEKLAFVGAFWKTWDSIGEDLANAGSKVKQTYVVDVVTDSGFMSIYGGITKEQYERFREWMLSVSKRTIQKLVYSN